MTNETKTKPGTPMVEVECLMDCSVHEADLDRAFEKGRVTVEARHFDYILSRYPQHFKQTAHRRFLSGAAEKKSKKT